MSSIRLLHVARGIGASVAVATVMLAAAVNMARASDEPPQDSPAPAPTAPATTAAARPDENPSLRLRLQEGSVVSGNLSVETVIVDTEFGKLEIPVASIISFTPGLDSHPEQKQQVGRLILQLGANASADREQAERKLLELGPKVRGLLERHSADEDTERRTRVQKILLELEELAADGDVDAADLQPWIDDDTVVTTRFTVVGRISPREFKVETKFGELDVALADIQRAEREGVRKPDLRKTVQVTSASLALTSFLSTGVRVERGDRIELRADGTLTMEPWGHEMKSTPDGGQNFGIFQPGISNGALVAKIGSNGQLFKVGSKHELTAKQSGVLYLAIALGADFANQGYTFPGQYNVKIRVQPK